MPYRYPSFIALITCILSICLTALGKDEAPLPTFGDTVWVLGAMSQTDQAFQDGLALDLFSPKNRTLTIQQNMSPLPAHFVSRTTGESWVALKNYSYIVKMNETAHDLVAEIEVSFNSSTLAALGVQKCNTFVGKLASDGQSWVVDNATRNVHKSENKTRIVNMTSLDGEYMLLGRQTIDAGSIFIQYGQGIARTLNVSGDNGIQSGDFVDGLNILIRSETALAVNVDLVNGINPGTLPANTLSLNPYAWVVNTSNPKANVMAEMHFPYNRALLPNNTDFTNISSVLTLARRPLNATTGQFLALNAAQQVQDIGADRILVPHLSQLDGKYILLVNTKSEDHNSSVVGSGGTGVDGARTSDASASASAAAACAASSGTTNAKSSVMRTVTGLLSIMICIISL